MCFETIFHSMVLSIIMSLANTISILAIEVESQLKNLSDSHRNILSVMKEMPTYLKKGDLAAWEASYRAAIDEDEAEDSYNWKVIDLIYDLAGFNLFAAFDVKVTNEIYQNIKKEFSLLDISISKNLEVDSW